MKTLLRIAIIIAACLVVTGVTYAVGQTDWANQAPTRFERSRAEGDSSPPATSERRPVGGREGRSADLSVRGWLGFGQTLIPMTVVITLVSFLTNMRKRRRQRPEMTVSIHGRAHIDEPGDAH
jgi:hypothetical protein